MPCLSLSVVVILGQQLESSIAYLGSVWTVFPHLLIGGTA
jgi:hypothetical protein